jgi:beta-phosphoglucomutase-like phosphatase (HAD superfamily)
MGAAPERTIVIEDSPSGAAAARAAGMRVYGYTADESAAALESAGAIVFGSMDELRFDRGFVQDFA